MLLIACSRGLLFLLHVSLMDFSVENGGMLLCANGSGTFSELLLIFHTRDGNVKCFVGQMNTARQL
jgi:hypothetical protein